jgi:serine/threonine protein phosphatase PrpC
MYVFCHLAFRSVDDWILASQSIEDSIDGCVAIVAILRGNSLTIANIGDCRAIKIHQCPFEGIGYDQLSTDHTPENQG